MIPAIRWPIRQPLPFRLAHFAKARGLQPRFTAFFSSYTNTPAKHRVVIAGGGSGGIALASRIKADVGRTAGAVAVVEPSVQHYYQPLFTLVGAGELKLENCRKQTRDLIPSGVDWYKTSVSKFKCAENVIELEDGRSLKYDVLVVCLGIRNDASKIKGLEESLTQDFIVTNYGEEHCERTWHFIQKFRKGTAIFTMPSGVVKCPGAPQKIMYLAEDYWRRQGCRDAVDIKFISGLASQFKIPVYADALNRICDQRGLDRQYLKNLVEILPFAKEAVFEVGGGGASGESKKFVKEHFDFLHVAPVQSPPDVLTSSDLCKEGFMDVNQHTLQSQVYNNVFGLGDCTNVPTSRTGAAAAVQSDAVATNVRAILKEPERKTELKGTYDGYASCPLVCGRQQCIMAEFNAFDGTLRETSPLDQSVPRYSMFLLKKYGLPLIYWNLMVKGLWRGPAMVRKALSPLRKLARN